MVLYQRSVSYWRDIGTVLFFVRCYNASCKISKAVRTMFGGDRASIRMVDLLDD